MVNIYIYRQEYQGDDDRSAPSENFCCYLCDAEVHFRYNYKHQGKPWYKIKTVVCKPQIQKNHLFPQYNELKDYMFCTNCGTGERW